MSVDGTYDMVMNTPMGKQEGKLVCQTQGDTLTGHMEQMGNKVDIENGKVEGDKLSWQSKITTPMPMTLNMTGTHSGDTIEGEAELGAFGKASYTATRA